MRKPTIKELRTRDIMRLAERLNPTPSPEQITEAAHVMRLFYRFAAVYEREFYIHNDRNTSDAEKAAAEAKEARAYKRAADALRPYNLMISCPGLDPIIEDASTRINFTYGHYYKYA